MGHRQRTGRFNVLVWPHAAAVLRLAKILAHDQSAADDLAQETLLKAFRSLDSLRDESKVKPWLMSILRHAHTDRIRREGDHTVSLDCIEFDIAAQTEPNMPDPASYQDPGEIIERLGDQEIITALRDLPKEIRWTLLLVDVEGLGEAQAADALSIPVGTVKSRLSRGRRMLRERLVPSAPRLHLAV